MTVRPGHMFTRPNLRSGRSCASQQNGGVDFRFGPEADIQRWLSYVRFTPESGITECFWDVRFVPTWAGKHNPLV